MNDTDCYIQRLFNSLSITTPQQLSINQIADKLRIKVIYWEFTSVIAEKGGEYHLFINQTLNTQQQWQDFGHEMKHYFFDQGNRCHLPSSFIDYREMKANNFAYLFCIPYFMLRQLKEVTIYDIANIFNVEYDFALKRLGMYKNCVMAAAESHVTYKGGKS